MELEPVEINLRIYLQIIRRRFLWILAVTVLIVVVAVAYSSVQKKQYSATAQLLVQPASGSVPISGTQQTVSSTDVLTELSLVTSTPVKTQVTKKLGYSPNVSAAEVGQTNLIGVTATASTPAEAATVANTYAKTFVAQQATSAIDAIDAAEQQLQGQINALNAQLQPLESQQNPSAGTTSTISALASQEAVLKEQLAELQVTGSETPGGIEVATEASPPTSPSSPKPLRDGALALGIGILLGLVAAFAVEYFDNKVYTKDEAERLSGGVPVLAMIPQIKSWKKATRPMLITELDPFSTVTEAYRSLRTSLQFAGHDGQMNTILVTSASGREGKTSTVANLGVVLSQANQSVVVVGCDLRRPRIASFLGRNETPGFTSVLLGQEELQNAIQPVRNAPGLSLLGSGPIPPNPIELVASDKAAEIFRTLADKFDIVLIDSPPLLPVADALVLSNYADAVLMVVMVGQTAKAQVERATELLAQADARPTGIVLNRVIRRSGGGAEYGYDYSYKYRYTPQPPLEVNHNGGGSPETATRRRSTSPDRTPRGIRQT